MVRPSASLHPAVGARPLIESATVQKWLRYSFATAFAGLGVKLAMTER